MPERKRGGNGWRAGTDPVVRWLRSMTTLTLLGVFVFLAIVRENNSTEGLVISALALGSVLLLLGYEGVIRLPMIGKTPEDDEDVEGSLSATTDTYD